jgi:hypothetical protein
MKRFGWVVVLGGLMACNTTPVAPGGVLVKGTWGSPQGRLAAMDASVQWTGACGTGSASQPILLDRKGRFDLTGTYTPAGSAPQQAQFLGKPDHGVMELTVKLPSQTIGPMVLELNQQPPMGACQ